MTASTSMITGSSTTTHRSNKSHRLEVHRHADQTLAEIEARNALLAARKTKKPSIVLSCISNLVRGLEGMFGAINIRP